MTDLVGKKMLALSFMDLADEEPISKISVTRISYNCGLSSAAFYYHFKDKEDLIIWLYEYLGKKLLKRINHKGYTCKDSLKDMITGLKKRNKLIRSVIIYSLSHHSFSFLVHEVTIKLIISLVKQKSSAVCVPSEQEHMIRFFCYGFIDIVLEWLLGNIDLTQDELIETIVKSLPKELSVYLI